MSITYKQETKNMVRHTVIRKAVELLTTERAQACCVRRSYVRDLYDYFNDLAESHEQEEAKKIDISYIQEWETMHSYNLGIKRPEELSVCYLAGPEPENDFAEFVFMGIKPQNIWAFECERNTYLQALTSIDSTNFMQPKLIKTSIERFFESSPKTFDIVYIDACASLISDQHALKCIASMFKHHRLSSPGVLISNFAYLDETVSAEKQQYIDIISRYNFIRDNRNAYLLDHQGTVIFNDGYEEVKKSVEEDLEEAYGDFVSAMICNTASISIPSVRFCNSNYLRSLSNTQPVPISLLQFQDVNTIKDNTLYKYLAMNCFLKQNSSSFEGVSKVDKLISEISAPTSGYDLLSSSKKLYEIKSKGVDKMCWFHISDEPNLQNMDTFRDYVRSTGVFGRGTNLGKALTELCKKKPAALNDATTLIIISDAQTVDRETAVRALLEAKRLAGQVLGLNPLAENHWKHQKSAQIMASICTMVSCNTLNALSNACKRLIRH